MNNDLISRQALCEYALNQKDKSITPNDIMRFPSAQPEQDKEFIKLAVRNSNGRPYYSIIYLEVDGNGVGHDFEGYSSYSLDVISDYLKKYFMPPAKPERKMGEWIYNSPVTMKCNQCGLVIKDWDWHKFKYCPNCAADMRENGERK